MTKVTAGDHRVECFNGVFAFVVWDAPRPRLFIARDRPGIKLRMGAGRRPATGQIAKYLADEIKQLDLIDEEVERSIQAE